MEYQPMPVMRWFVILSILLVSASCGSKGPAVDTKPFAAAIEDYLKVNSMGMKVHAFKDLQVEGNTATARVSLGHAEEATAIRVQWDFSFAQNNGHWTVTNCTH